MAKVGAARGPRVAPIGRPLAVCGDRPLSGTGWQTAPERQTASPGSWLQIDWPQDARELPVTFGSRTARSQRRGGGANPKRGRKGLAGRCSRLWLTGGEPRLIKSNAARPFFFSLDAEAGHASARPRTGPANHRAPASKRAAELADERANERARCEFVSRDSLVDPKWNYASANSSKLTALGTHPAGGGGRERGAVIKLMRPPLSAASFMLMSRQRARRLMDWAPEWATGNKCAGASMRERAAALVGHQASENK